LTKAVPSYIQRIQVACGVYVRACAVCMVCCVRAGARARVWVHVCMYNMPINV